MNSPVHGSVKTLAEPEADRLRRRWALRNVVAVAPFAGLLALPWFVPFNGLDTVSGWVLITGVVGSIAGSVFLSGSLAKCPTCQAALKGVGAPSVCKSCRTLLRPASQEGWEILQRLSRPAVTLSPAELEEFEVERRHKEWWIGGIIGAFATAFVTLEYVQLDVPWFVSTAAVPVGIALIRTIARSSRCPTCSEVIPLEAVLVSCESCGTRFTRTVKE